MAAPLALAAACAAPPPLFGPPEPPARTVTVHNRSERAAQLEFVVAHGFVPLAGARVAPGERTKFRLRPGRYALRAVDGDERMPLPVLADVPAASAATPRPLATLAIETLTIETLTIEPWPAAQPGWCWIPPGPGLVGDDLGVGQPDERPVRTPHLAGFWLAAHETSNAEYVAFLNAIGTAAVDPTWLDLDGSKCRVQQDPASGMFSTDAPRLPVVTVSWPGAVAYCEWRSRETGVRHRLPNEAEWEKAARGPGSRVYAYGDVCTTEAANQESGRLREVGCYAPNGYGLYDMTANAFEWCADEWTVDADRPMRMLRGGSFVLDGIFCRNSMRMRLRPSVRADDVGFRVLRELPRESR